MGRAAQAGSDTSAGTIIEITKATVDHVLRDLPLLARKALAFAAGIKRGSLEIELPDGRMLRIRGEEQGTNGHLKIYNYNFAKRFITEGDLGLAESNLQGEWESRDLTAFFRVFAENVTMSERFLKNRPITRLLQLYRHWKNRNSKAGSRRNIHAHYDIGNSFYDKWLDRTMTYSSAIFAPGDNDLAAAQTRKYRSLAEMANIKPGDHVLEIGCGWGGFAEFAASEIGCKLTCLTISTEQFNYASKRIADAGLADRVTFKLQDYREETGRYDAIASIEMFEAVGEKYWPTYFGQLRDLLKPGARAGLQVITIRDEGFEAYRSEVDFIQAYIFPGGMLPSPKIMQEMGEKYTVPLVNQRIFGIDYAETLAQWRERFRAAWPELTRQGFDERFRRMWEYYLAYCEAGFRAKTIDVRQMIFERG
jgi:cyclopropane-fatty-acyl-phospholipid synthase